MANDGPGLLESAIIGAPVVAGVAAAVRQSRAGTTEVGTTSSLLGAMRTGSAAKGEASVADFLRYMGGKEKFFLEKEGARVAQQAWEQAMAAADPMSKQKLLSFTSKLGTYKNPQDVYTAIRETVGRNQSNLMQRVTARFRENVDVLSWQQSKLGNLPDISSVRELRLKPSTINPVDMIPGVSSYFNDITKGLGATGGLAQQITRPGLPGEAYRFHWQAAGGLEVGFNLPITRDGTMLMGQSLQTRYISPDILLATPQDGGGFKYKSMARHEYFLREFETTIMPALKEGRIRSQGELDVAIKSMSTSIFRELETLPNMPEGLEPSWMQGYRDFRGQQVDIRIATEAVDQTGPFNWKASTRDPRTAEYMSIMEERKLFGGVGATGVSKGRAQTFDIADLYPTPRRTAMGRSPQQAVRAWGYTGEAQARAASVAELGAFDTAAREAYASAPYLTTAYVDPEKYAGELERLGVNEGEALMSSRVKGIMQQEYATSTHLTAVDRDVMNAIRAGETVAPGTVLGRSAKTGALVTAPSAAEGAIMGIENFKDVNKGDFVTLWQMNRRRLGQQEKWFGDLKALARFTEDDLMRFSTGRGFGMRAPVDVLASFDDLVKDPAKLNKQIMTGMYQTMLDKDLGPWGERFMRKPLSFAHTWDRTQKSQQAFVERAMGFAVRHGNVTGEEFGRIFGAVPKVFGAKAAYQMASSAGVTSTQTFREMFRGIAVGGAQLTWGGPHEGVGGLGNIEPRVFDILEGAPYRDTPFASELADDLARRVAITSPEKVSAFEDITKSLSSMQGQISMPGTADWDVSKHPYSRGDFQNFIERGGGWMKMGEGRPDVFVPGVNTPAMQPHATPTGKIAGYLPDVYHRIAERGGAFASGDLGAGAMDSYMKKAMAELAGQAAPAGKGLGGFLRGKVTGSRRLKAVSQIGNYTPTDLNTVGISKSHIENMFGEMRRTGMYGSELTEMFEQFKSTGKVQGMVARDPLIGAFSLQPVMFEAVDTLEDSIAVAEKKVRMNIGGEVHQMNLSPMLGMAADKDADALSAFLVSPKSAKQLAHFNQMAGNEYQVAYAQHQMRLQLVKAKKSAGAMTLAQIEKNVYGDIAKLGITQREVPFLSTELTTARRASLQHMKGKKLADAQFLLEWLEQTPISGKHIAGEKTLSFEAQMEAIRRSFTQRDATSLIGEINEIVKPGTAGQKLLSQDLAISGARDAEKALGFSLGNKLSGIDVEGTAKGLMSSLHKFEKSGELAKAQLISGTGGRLFQPGAIKQFLQTVSFSGGHAMGEAVGARGTIENLLGKAGRGMIRHHKPIGYGLAGAIALSLALSSPNETVGSGRGMQTRVSLNRGKGAGRMKQDDMQVSAQMGSPSAPGMMHQNAVHLAGPPRTRAHVRARSNFMVTPSSLASSISGMTGGGSSVNLNVRDSRSSNNPYTMADKIFG